MHLALGYGIDDLGDVVGSGSDAGGQTNYALLYTVGTIVRLGVLPGTVSSVALSIDNAGQIVGYSRADSISSRAFLYQAV